MRQHQKKCFGGTLIGLIALVVFVISPMHEPSLAQQINHVITYDQAVMGTLSDTNLSDTWAFDAPGQDVVSIAVTRDATAGQMLNTLIPEVVVQGIDGKIVAQAEHDKDTLDKAAINMLPLPIASRYAIVISRFQGRSGKTQGAYHLTIHLIGAGLDRLNAFERQAFQDKPNKTSVIPDGSYYTHTGVITNEHWSILYLLEPQTPDANLHQPSHITVGVSKTDGNLIPTLSLFRLDKAPSKPVFMVKDHVPIAVGKHDNNSPKFDLVIDVTVPEDGVYFALVSRQDNEKGLTTGTYEVSSNGGSAVPVNTFPIIDINASKSSLISIGQWSLFSYVSDRAQVITINVKRTSGNLVPLVVVYSPSATPLASSVVDPDTFSTANIQKVSLPAAGIYVVAVGAVGELLGKTSGSFDITMSSVGS